MATKIKSKPRALELQDLREENARLQERVAELESQLQELRDRLFDERGKWEKRLEFAEGENNGMARALGVVLGHGGLWWQHRRKA